MAVSLPPVAAPSGAGWIFSLVFGTPAFLVVAVAVVLNWGR